MNHVLVEFIVEGGAPRVQAGTNRVDFTFDTQLHPQTRYHVNVPGLPDTRIRHAAEIAGDEPPFVLGSGA